VRRGADRAKGSPSEDALGKLLGSTSRARILSLLFDNPGTEFYQREIVFETGLSLQPVQRELGILAELGVVTARETRARTYYRLNSESVWFGPLQDLVESARGGEIPTTPGRLVRTRP